MNQQKSYQSCPVTHIKISKCKKFVCESWFLTTFMPFKVQRKEIYSNIFFFYKIWLLFGFANYVIMFLCNCNCIFSDVHIRNTRQFTPDSEAWGVSCAFQYGICSTIVRDVLYVILCYIGTCFNGTTDVFNKTHFALIRTRSLYWQNPCSISWTLSKHVRFGSATQSSTRKTVFCQYTFYLGNYLSKYI